MTGYELTRGVLCAMRRPSLPAVEELCAGARRVAVLEGIVDPTNVGAIFRSAAALHMDGVLVTPTCCDPLHRRAVRVSMGTVFQIPWTYIGARSADWPQPGLARSAGPGLSDRRHGPEPRSPLHRGLPAGVRRKAGHRPGHRGGRPFPRTVAHCDYTVCIPMARGVDSLNVAAASAVAFWQLGRYK